MENKNIIVEENTNYSEEPAERMEEDRDHTKGLEDEDNIFKVLLDMHEEVPLEDPGPGVASVDRAEGAAAGVNQLGVGVGGDIPLEDPGPITAGVDREEGAVGATQLGVGGEVPLEDPGPKTVNEHGGEGDAGATQ